VTELNREFGDLLTRGLKSIAIREENKPILPLEDELGYEMGIGHWSIDRWRQGYVPSDPKRVAHLARTCVKKGGMDKQWLLRFLTQARFHNKEALIQELFPQENLVLPSDLPVTRNNLPRRSYEKFVGREKELAELRRYLSPRFRLGVICLSGIAGVGKTALALEITHRYWKSAALPADERFEAIVWVTAKQTELLPKGLTTRRPTFSDLDSLYRAIAEVLDLPAITRAGTTEDRDIIVARTLVEHRVLLVLDNLEDIDDEALMVFLRDLPTPSKAIVTTRHRIDVAVSIQMKAFNEIEAHDLVRAECHRHSLFLTEEETDKLLKHAGYLPLAIVRTIGRMAWRESSIEIELHQLGNPTNPIYDFCFERSISLIRGKDAHKLFMALGLFSADASRDALGYVAGFEDDILDRDEGLGDLEVLSLVNKEGHRFNLEALTKVKAQTELEVYSEFGQEARKRLIEFYLNLAKQYGGKDWGEWHVKYNHIEEEWKNQIAIFEYCAVHAKEDYFYSALRDFWQSEGVLYFAHLYGHWNDRLKYLTLLIHFAERRRDWPSLVEAEMHKAYSLMVLGRLEEADKLFKRAWNRYEHARPIIQINLSQNIARLCIYQKQYDDASFWLEQAKNLLDVAHFDEKEHVRRHVTTQNYYGLLYFEMQKYELAKIFFTECKSRLSSPRDSG
jgi:tetratricopeptide (TPR) repeat protein